MGCAREHRPAHHRLRLPVPRAIWHLDAGHQHEDHGNGRDDRGTGGEHVLRRGGAGDECGGHERLVGSGYRGDERPRRKQPARVLRGRDRHAERERNRAGRHVHWAARRRDRRRFGRHADLRARRARRGAVRHQHDKRPASHEVRRHAARRRDVHGDCRGRRPDRNRQDYGFDRRYRCAAEQPARFLRWHERHAQRARRRAGGHEHRWPRQGHGRRFGRHGDPQPRRAGRGVGSTSTRQPASFSRYPASR